MGTRHFDFGQLTAAERIALAGELWDSLEPSDVTISGAQAAELDRRSEKLRTEGSSGRPWREVIEELKQRGG